MQQLKNAGYHVIEKWSCEFSDKDRWHAHEFGLQSKVPQLVPKDAFFGGCTEAINLWKTLSEDEIQNGKEILYYNMTSEYPFVNSWKEYPVGHPKIFLKHQVPQTNEEWQRRGFFGVALCSIVPLKSCYILCYLFVIKAPSCFPSVASVVWKNAKTFVNTKIKSGR